MAEVPAVIAAAEAQSPIDAYMGVGGAPDGVLAAAAVAGRLSRLAVRGGDMVNEGQLLFQLDDSLERAAGAEAEADTEEDEEPSGVLTLAIDLNAEDGAPEAPAGAS